MELNLKNFSNMKMEILNGFQNLRIAQNGKIDYRKYVITKNDYIVNVIKAFFLAMLISYTFYKNIIFAIFATPICLVYPFLLKDDLSKKRRNKLLLEFKDMINILMSYIDAGYSTENAFLTTKKDIKKLYKDGSLMEAELDYICKYIAINKPIEIPLRDFAYRSGIDDIVDFAEVFILAKKAGGELHKIINNTVHTIRDKIQISMDIQTKTSEKQFEQSIMNLIPFLIILYLNLTSKDFLLPMYSTFIGRLIMTVLLIAYFFAYKLSKKILNIEV